MIEILKVGVATVQDLAGRRGHMHEGVPPGGALVPELLEIANAAAGASPAAAAIETFHALTVRARGKVRVGTSDGMARVLAPGEELTIVPEHRVAYLAVEGGIDAPIVLGGRGPLPGQPPLRKGALLAAGDLRAPREAPPFTLGSIHVIPVDERILERDFTISPASDRVGTRLASLVGRVGAPPATNRSRPMVRGAIQLPDEPIVLGPDHPTTGGYAVAGFVARADLGRLFALRPGVTVRFLRYKEGP
jgi:allophanate hydrolase subunit 2